MRMGSRDPRRTPHGPRRAAARPRRHRRVPVRPRRRRRSRQRRRKYVIGVSNTLVGNGWREEMICAVKAQAPASGVVSKVIVANRNGGAAEQIADIRNLISAGANAIIINPSSATALNGVIARGRRARRQDRLRRPARDRAAGVQRHERPGRLRPARRRVAVQEARRQGQRRRDARHRRRPGRHRPPHGLHAGAKQVPGHQGREVRRSPAGSSPPGGKQILDILNSGTQVDGVWTSASTTRSSTRSRRPGSRTCRSSAPTTTSS